LQVRADLVLVGPHRLNSALGRDALVHVDDHETRGVPLRQLRGQRERRP
jgi:hypothetical protein